MAVVTIDASVSAMPPEQHAVRPTRRPSPRFADDPLGWLAWLDSVDPAEDELIRLASRPAVWVDASGRGWRVVTTADGPEIRPTLDAQSIPRTSLPLITCLLVTRDMLRLELSSRHTRLLETLPRGGHSLVDIGKAMFTASELPHENVARMSPDAFRLARRRWDAEQRAGQKPAGSKTEAAPKRQARATKPVRSS